MKLKSAFIFLLPVFCILVLTTAVLALEVPAPYTDLKNPFAWNDASTQSAGRILFRQYCLTCHGGGGVEAQGVINFAATDYRAKLESTPDYYFWKVSDGIAATDMPLFKFSLSETQRWQVLTYIWSLGAPPVVEPVTPAAPVPPPVVEPVTPVIPATPVPPLVVEPVTPATPTPAPTPATSTPAPTPTPTSTSNGGGFSCSKPAQANQGKNDVDISLILGGMGWLALVFVSRRRP